MKFRERIDRGPSPLGQTPVGDTDLTVKIKVVTYLHGGGPTSSERDDDKAPTRKPDALTPLRGTTIRGQLRFWWRATYGCTLPTVAAMREAEDALWGNASKPGKVDLALAGRQTATDVSTKTLGDVGQGLRYAAFASKNVTSLSGATELRVTLRDAGARPQVEDALRAWLLFGGVGGRTRRGFGALESDWVGVPPREFLQRFKNPSTLHLVPSLHGATVELAQRSFDKAHDAHRDALDKLRDFRQKAGLARNEGQGGVRSGRSRWPEPDELRRLMKRHAPRHAPTHPVSAFPRAAFGLPIVFHFKDREDPGGTLTPERGAGRMASPIILRPTREGSSWKAMALRLHVPGLDAKLGTVHVGTRAVRGTLQGDECQEISPLKNRGTDVLAAFLKYFKSESP